MCTAVPFLQLPHEFALLQVHCSTHLLHVSPGGSLAVRVSVTVCALSDIGNSVAPSIWVIGN